MHLVFSYRCTSTSTNPDDAFEELMRHVDFMALRLPCDVSQALATHAHKLGKSKTAFVRDLVASAIGVTIDPATDLRTKVARVAMRTAKAA
jgi:predicted DNA-binding protein